MFVLADTENQGAIIKVVGVGGGGGNAVTHMVNSGIDGVDFVCINTDAQALKHSKVKTSLQIGSNITKGLGAGADPEVGRQAAMEDRDRIIELIEGSDMIFITAGMGGGTGTGAAPIVAQVAKELGILTVAVVTKPFEMEGNKRTSLADQGIDELHKYVDSLITIPNQKLLTVLGGDMTLLDAFRSANQVLQGAVQGIAELITRPGMINVDFADVRTVMAETGMAMMGSGNATRREPRPRRRRSRDLEPAARGREPVGRARPADQRHGRHGPAHERVPHRRRDREAVRVGRRHRRRRLRDRPGDDGPDPRHRRRDRHRPRGGQGRAAADGRTGRAGGRRVVARRSAVGRLLGLDTPPRLPRAARAVGDGLSHGPRRRIVHRHPGVPAPAGRLTIRRLSRRPGRARTGPGGGSLLRASTWSRADRRRGCSSDGCRQTPHELSQARDFRDECDALHAVLATAPAAAWREPTQFKALDLRRHRRPPLFVRHRRRDRGAQSRRIRRRCSASIVASAAGTASR